jgi:hypothetical protein
MNQEQYLQELDDFFSINRSFMPEMIVIENAGSMDNQAKTIALANGTDEVSVLSQLTEKTLKAATSAVASGKNIQDDGSMASGNTSRSKTQAAVKDALKEVSLEHNKAMEEQRLKFQRELEALRKEMERNTNQAINFPSTPAPTINEIQENPPIATPMDTESEVHTSQNEKMDIDSSDDEVALVRSRQHTRRIVVSAKDNKSPITKRTRRSKSRTPRGKGGPVSHPSDPHV